MALAPPEAVEPVGQDERDSVLQPGEAPASVFRAIEEGTAPEGIAKTLRGRGPAAGVRERIPVSSEASGWIASSGPPLRGMRWGAWPGGPGRETKTPLKRASGMLKAWKAWISSPSPLCPMRPWSKTSLRRPLKKDNFPCPLMGEGLGEGVDSP